MQELHTSGGPCTVKDMTHTEWLDETTGSDSPRKIEAKTGIPFRTVTSQRNRDNISAENVIKIAVGYGTHPVGALVETGYLDAKFAETIDPKVAARLLSEEELADEVLRRLKVGAQTDVFTTPIDDLAARRPPQPPADDEIAAALEEANQFKGAAHPRTPCLDEPEAP